ncbi:MAG: hypothetical protein ACRDRX_18550 [Pseudonocardiaceae bacterium]
MPGTRTRQSAASLSERLYAWPEADGRSAAAELLICTTPQNPEDFLHGAACHCCVMASETSCERANRFLDRRFLVDLPGSDIGQPRG